MNLARGVILALCLWTAAPVAAQPDLTAAREMVTQGDRLMASGRPCEAAARYRAVVGELPGVFVRYAEARAACLGLPG